MSFFCSVLHETDGLGTGGSNLFVFLVHYFVRRGGKWNLASVGRGKGGSLFITSL